jgi:hypothetical protein
MPVPRGTHLQRRELRMNPKSKPEGLRTWAEEHGLDPETQPVNLGIRITYLAYGPVTETSDPYCDFAVPFT